MKHTRSEYALRVYLAYCENIPKTKQVLAGEWDDIKIGYKYVYFYRKNQTTACYKMEQVCKHSVKYMEEKLVEYNDNIIKKGNR